MYPVNVFQTSIKNFIVLIQGNWTITKFALKFHSITNNILHILKRLQIYNAAIYKSAGMRTLRLAHLFIVYEVKNFNENL